MKLPLAVSLAVVAAFAAEKVSTPIDNDQVKVLNVLQQPHEKTRPHRHTVNRVMIYLQAGTQNLDAATGKRTVLNWKAGEVKWSPATGTHVAEITSANPVNIVEVELKKAGSAPAAASAFDPVKVDPRHYKVILENDQVRVLRVKIGPHQSTPLHEHVLNRVVVYLTDQKFRVTGADGKVETAAHKAGDVGWGGPTKHTEENLSGMPFEVVAVELKD